MNPNNSPKIYYLNALFDLEIGEYDIYRFTNSADSMSVLFSLMGNRNDRFITDCQIPKKYWEYFDTAGINYALPYNKKKSYNRYSPVIWGLNNYSKKRLCDLGVSVNCPDLSVIKSVNSRLFCLSDNLKNLCVPLSGYCTNIEDLSLKLHNFKNYPVVIKPIFGNSGYLFIHKKNSKLLSNEKNIISMLITKHGGVVVEPWLNRVTDISTSFELSQSGSITNIRYHINHTGKSGNFFGILINNNDEIMEKWGVKIRLAIDSVASELYNTKYFGPVGIDSLLWSDNTGKINLVPVVEINARYTMGNIAHHLQSYVEGKVSYFRFISRKRLRLPDNYDELLEILGPKAYNNKSQKGILVLSPLRILHDSVLKVPARVAFFLVANTYEELFDLDIWLREILKK